MKKSTYIYQFIGLIFISFVLFVPLFFILDEDGIKNKQSSFAQITATAEIPVFNDNPLNNPLNLKDNNQEKPQTTNTVASTDIDSLNSDKFFNNPADPVIEPEPKNRVNNNDLPWVIRVATFGNENNAIKMKEKIQDHIRDSEPYIKPVTANNKTLYVVMLGPWKTKKEAKRYAMAVAFQYKLKSTIVNTSSK